MVRSSMTNTRQIESSIRAACTAPSHVHRSRWHPAREKRDPLRRRSCLWSRFWSSSRLWRGICRRTSCRSCAPLWAGCLHSWRPRVRRVIKLPYRGIRCRLHRCSVMRAQRQAHRLTVCCRLASAGMVQQPEAMQLLFECLSTVFKHLVEHLVSMLPEVCQHGRARPHTTTSLTIAASGSIWPRGNPHAANSISHCDISVSVSRKQLLTCDWQAVCADASNSSTACMATSSPECRFCGTRRACGSTGRSTSGGWRRSRSASCCGRRPKPAWPPRYGWRCASRRWRRSRSARRCGAGHHASTILTGADHWSCHGSSLADVAVESLTNPCCPPINSRQSQPQHRPACLLCMSMLSVYGCRGKAVGTRHGA